MILFLDADSHASPGLLEQHLSHHYEGRPRIVVGQRLEMGPPQLDSIIHGESPDQALCGDVRLPEEITRFPWRSKYHG